MTATDITVTVDRAEHPARPLRTPSIWRGSLGPTTIGVFALAFMIAFEALAVSTVMPVVAGALDGISWYAVAFAAPTAVAVVALTLAGPWMDRHGPALALAAGVAVFSAGLVLAGLATTMPVFVAGRAVQGFGGGVIGVGIYVLIAKAYPADLQPRVFALLTAAWVLPGLAGPFLAAHIAEAFGWRWVFLGVPAVAVVALALITRSMCRCPGDPDAPLRWARVVWAVLVAGGVSALAMGGQRAVTGWPVLLIGGLALVLVGAPQLLPRGSWRGGRGLPSVIGTRSLMNAGYGAAEAYLPLALIRFHDLTPVQAGAALTAGALTWFGGAWLGAHVDRLSDELLRVRLGLLLSGLAAVGSIAVVLHEVPAPVIIVGWALGGLGMGLGSTALSVLVLRHSPTGQEGGSSSAAQINDSVVVALALALGSVGFAALLPVDPAAAIVLVLGLAAAVTLAAWLPLRRIGRPETRAELPA